MTDRSTPPADKTSAPYALTIWLAVIAMLGGLRFVMRAFDESRFTPDTMAWVWLAGGTLAALAALASWAHVRRGARGVQ